jgi:hypothetical protein
MTMNYLLNLAKRKQFLVKFLYLKIEILSYAHNFYY